MAALRASRAFTRAGLRWCSKAAEAPDFQHAKCYSKSSDIVVVRGEGCYVYDKDGRKYLDATSGIAVLSTGHCHPRIVQAIQDQSSKLIHGQLNCFQSHESLDGLIPRLGRVMPKGIDTFVVDTTGTQAIEAAVKLARRYTKRPHIVCMKGSFHGRSALCSAMTSSNTGPRIPLATPLPSGVYFTSYPMSYRWRCSDEEATQRAISDLRDLFRSQVAPDQVAAMVTEPVLGEGGFIPMQPAYMEAAAELCREHGILMIADEVQSGVGRTGKMWGCQYYPETALPDIIVSAKGIASGMPLSVIGSSKQIMECYTAGSHGGTYMGNPVSCASACATLDVIEEEGLVENSRRLGELLLDRLKEAQQKYLPSGDVRGRGLMVGMEFRKADGSAAPEVAQAIRSYCLKECGLLLYAPSGWDACLVRIMPPLIITENEANYIADCITKAIQHVSTK